MPNFPQVKTVDRKHSAHHLCGTTFQWFWFAPQKLGSIQLPTCLEHWLDVRGSWCSDVPVQHIAQWSVSSQDPSHKLFLFPTTNQCTEEGMKPPCTHTQNWAVLPPRTQGTEQTGTLPLGMKGHKGLSAGKGQWRASTWLFGMEGAGSCCCLSHHGSPSTQSNGRVTQDWVVFSAERGGADLAVLHRALTTPNEDVSQQAECLAAAEPESCRWGQEDQQQGGNSSSVSHFHHGLLQPSLLIIYL